MADPRGDHALGHDAEALTGHPLARIVSPDQHGHLSRILERMGSAAVVWEQLTLLAADGRRHEMLCCFQRLQGDDQPRGGLLLTGLKLGALEENLRAQASTVLGQLAHRCHGPAHRLMQAVEAIVAQYPWCDAAQRCRADLDDLLDALSQTTAWPQAVPEGRPVEVVALLESVLRLTDGDPAYSHVTIALRPECREAWAAVHPVGLTFVALHLMANARDATLAAESARLNIDVNADGDRVVLEFQDNGRGLDCGERDCALAPLLRPTSDDGRPHSGVGLATCCQLVEFMGGRIRMRSRPSVGTTVVVTLPAARRDA
jgi:signal transduction histidine kinase